MPSDYLVLYFVTKIVLTYCENCSSDRENLLKFEAEGLEFEKNLISLEQFIQTECFLNLFTSKLILAISYL